MEYALLCSGTLFAIVSPFATAPTFLAMTEGENDDLQISMAARACALSCFLLVVFSLFGETILGAFRVGVPALQISGGLVILRVAFALIGGERKRLTPAEHDEAEEKEDITVTPLAIPILCGPGTITSGIVLGTQAATYDHRLILISAIVSIYFLTFCLLYAAVRSSRWAGTLVLRVLGRLMGMLLAAVAIQFILSGLVATFPGALEG